MNIFLNPLAKLVVFIQLSNEQSLTFSVDFIFFADSIYFIASIRWKLFSLSSESAIFAPLSVFQEGLPVHY